MAVIYSFKSRWESDLRSKDLGVFFRKKAPKNIPSTVLFYVGNPIGAVIGMARVTKIEKVDISQAIDLAELGKIKIEELQTYLGDKKYLNAIFISEHVLFKKAVGSRGLRSIFNFFPPQNFNQISNDIKDEIVRLSNA